MFDGKISVFIRSGMTEGGISFCWKEHTTSSMLLNHDLMTNKFYSSYSNEVCTRDNIEPIVLY